MDTATKGGIGSDTSSMASREELRRQLENLRARLLDLSNRNSLLNYRHPVNRCLRFVDEQPEVIFHRLTNGHSFVLAPVSRPTEDELRDYWKEKGKPVIDENGQPLPLDEPPPDAWARWIGIDTSYDLPAPAPNLKRLPRRHRDDRLQTLLYPDRLHRQARRMRSHARGAIEERGVNMLFLALGFLEWKDKNEDRPCLAPLLLLRATLEEEKARDGSQRHFVVRLLEDEEPTDNRTLRMRLERDFGISLPVFDTDDDSVPSGPEAYFAAVEKVVCKSQPDWRVRRMATLGFFQFQRLMLYADLDPANWPADALLDSPLVQGILGHRDLQQGFPDLSPEENDIELELVTLADSSQAAAIKAALEGRNLVIQGPPGTGKSQTITNLIAAFLAKGKRVLFIAEKMAALEVVHRRLQQMGLADFCLELHSHNTRKQSIMEALSHRLVLHQEKGAAARSDHAGNTLDRQLQQLRRQRSRLVDYIKALETETSLGKPAHWVLGMAFATRRQLQEQQTDLPERLRELEIPSWHDMNLRELEDHEKRLAHLAETLQHLETEGFDAARSPWRGVSAQAVTEMDLPEIRNLVHAALAALKAVQEAFRNIAKQTGVDLDDRLEDVEALPDTLEQVLNFLNRRHNILAAWEALQWLRNELDLPLPGGWRGLMLARDLCQLAIHLPARALQHLSSHVITPDFEHAYERLTEKLKALRRYRAELEKIVRLDRAERETPDFLRDMASIIGNAGWLSWLLDSDYREARKRFQLLLRPGKDNELDNAERARLLERLADYLEKATAFVETKVWKETFGDLFAGLETDVDFLDDLAAAGRKIRESNLDERVKDALLEWAPERWKQLAKRADIALTALQRVFDDPELKDCASGMEAFTPREAWEEACHTCLPQPWAGWCRIIKEDADDLNALSALADELRERLDSWWDAWTEFADRCRLDENRWSGTDNGVIDLHIQDLLNRLQVALDADRDEWNHWLIYERSWKDARSPETAPLLDWAIKEDLSPALLPLALRYAVVSRVAKETYTAHPILQMLDRVSLERARREYADLDRRIMETRRQVIVRRLLDARPPEGRRGARKAEWTEMALIMHEAGKKRRHLSFRNLLKRAGTSLQTLFPCFMMSPLSMAQYLPAGHVQFDVVIMDEASQLRPETCITALARSQQAIIVGDDKQMPPSRYFERTLTEEEEDEETTVEEEAESILELARTACDETTLRWHYRSRHESLIRFSNHYFYDGQLIVFPSPEGNSGRYGIRFHYVKDGIYANQVNEREAMLAVEAALRVLETNEGSVGVVTMNQRQQERVEALLFDRIYSDIALRERLERLEEIGEPLFVKNLENVQGDERDIIIISLTYGPSEPGAKVNNRFGPINMAMGWRRLNVLFTRARKRIELFSSMRAADINPEDNRGRQVLHDYLIYAESGRLPIRETVENNEEWPHTPQSPFEEEVIATLKKHGYDVLPQVGVDGYYIDIGVRHPERPGTFLAGIECDGASYHSGFYIRERDLIRQQHLESLGWNIYRIWSRDWYTDPENETRYLLDWLNSLHAPQQAS